jgi:hypothetical protein
MKPTTQRYILIVAILALTVQANLSAQTLLLDSLHGKWTMHEQYNNKTRVETKGSVEFLEDGTFKSDGSYFGNAAGLYTTDESKSTIQIVIQGNTSEWTASIRNEVLTMTRLRKKKTPRVELVLVSERRENNAGSGE